MTGNWHAVFITAAIMNIVAAVMALVLLKPMRSSYTKRAEAVGAQPRPAT
jgi:OFA family oxalate/formate antiporter-like MFS transporter